MSSVAHTVTWDNVYWNAKGIIFILQPSEGIPIGSRRHLVSADYNNNRHVGSDWLTFDQLTEERTSYICVTKELGNETSHYKLLP